MKFSDIPTFISSGNYEIDVPLGSIKDSLKDLRKIMDLNSTQTSREVMFGLKNSRLLGLNFSLEVVKLQE